MSCEGLRARYLDADTVMCAVVGPGVVHTPVGEQSDGGRGNSVQVPSALGEVGLHGQVLGDRGVAEPNTETNSLFRIG